MVVAKEVIYAIVFGALCGQTDGYIQSKLEKMNIDMSEKSIRDQRKKHVDPRGRPRHLETAGERADAGRPPLILSEKEQNKVVKFTKRNRGYIPGGVTSKCIKDRYEFSDEDSKPSRRTIGRILNKKGLKYKKRRGKGNLSKVNKVKRVAYSKKLLKTPGHEFRNTAYTDGASFFLPKSWKQMRDAFTASLGPFVYRDESEGLLPDCVGAPKYTKGQGLRVQIWGVLNGGRLRVTIVPGNVKWNQKTFARIIEKKNQALAAQWFKGSREEENCAGQ